MILSGISMQALQTNNDDYGSYERERWGISKLVLIFSHLIESIIDEISTLLILIIVGTPMSHKT